MKDVSITSKSIISWSSSINLPLSTMLYSPQIEIDNSDTRNVTQVPNGENIKITIFRWESSNRHINGSSFHQSQLTTDFKASQMVLPYTVAWCRLNLAPLTACYRDNLHVNDEESILYIMSLCHSLKKVWAQSEEKMTLTNEFPVDCAPMPLFKLSTICCGCCCCFYSMLS